MKNIIILFFIIFPCFLNSCENQKVGYLDCTYATYQPNKITINKPISESGKNYITAPIQGVEGTSPLFFSIASVKSAVENANELLKKNVTLRGNGVFDINYNHDLPEGEYLISIQVKNEDHVHIIDDIFTIVVQ